MLGAWGLGLGAVLGVGQSIFDRGNNPYKLPEVRSTAWDMVNSQDFTQRRQHGYGQGYIDNKVRLAMNAQRDQIVAQARAQQSQLAANGMEFSGISDRVNAGAINRLAGLWSQANQAAWTENEGMKMQYENQYLSTANAYDQMVNQRNIAQAQLDANVNNNKPSFLDNMMGGLSLGAMLI
jgi:hypothetical protein